MSDLSNKFLGKEIEGGVSQLLNQFGDAIDKLTEFGAQILEWDLEKASGGDHLLPAPLFFRNFLELIDATSILIRNSSVDPCKSLMRTSLETLFYLDYLLTEDQERRALCFLVWNTHRNIKTYKKVDGQSELFKQLKSKYKNDKFLKDASPIIFDILSQNQMANALEMLELPSYKPINEEYQRTKEKIKNPNWYSLFDGPQNIEGLANKSQFSVLYDVLYRSWSNSIHGTDIIQGKISQGPAKTVEVLQIRYPKEAQSITQYCFNLCIPIFKTFIEKRIPSRINEFNIWDGEIRGIVNKLSENELLTIK